MRKTVLTVVALAVLTCSTVVWGQGPPKGGPGGPPPPPPSAMMAVLPPPAGALDGIVKTLGLTTDQATSLKAILTTSDATIQPLVKIAGDASKALHDSLFASTFDADAVAVLASTAQTAEGDVIAAAIQVWTQIRTDATLNLTADQLAKLQAGCGSGGPPPPGPPPSGSGSGGSSTSTKRR